MPESTAGRDRHGMVAPTVVTLLLLALSVIGTAFAFGFDLGFGNNCDACQAADSARAIYLAGTGASVLIGILAVPLALMARRSMALMPLIAAAGPIISYVVARTVLYG